MAGPTDVCRVQGRSGGWLFCHLPGMSRRENHDPPESQGSSRYSGQILPHALKGTAIKTTTKKPHLYKRRTKKAGLAPGTLVYTGDKKVDSVRITYIDYDEKQLHEEQASRIEECFEFKQTPTVTWINVYDHTIQVIDTVEGFRDMVSGMLDTYLSSVSNKMNNVMKVLTIIATIFIPLTFVAGIYGMNFEYMPELKWRYSYAVLWFVMLAMFVGMVVFFRRKKWW